MSLCVRANCRTVAAFQPTAAAWRRPNTASGATRGLMGVEFHITRAEFWAENNDSPITAEEWLSYVASDSELSLDAANGRYFVRWLGASAYDEPWLDWFQENISTKWPDTALYQKMLRV